jgi:hypothetical protein
MVSAQWEEALSPLSINPALFEDGFSPIIFFPFFLFLLHILVVSRYVPFSLALSRSRALALSLSLSLYLSLS